MPQVRIQGSVLRGLIRGRCYNASMAAPLFLLPFDHRSTFVRDLLGISGRPGNRDRDRVLELKHIIFEGFLLAREGDRRPDDLGILVDEEYGSDVIRSARDRGIPFAVPVEKSGQPIFDFEYGQQFGDHILRLRPTYVKALVRYNPANIADNALQRERLSLLSAFCRKEAFPLLFELLVPPTPDDTAKAGSVLAYDRDFRWELTVRAIREIRKDVDVDVWKIEGMPDGHWTDVIREIGPDSRIIVLGRGQDEQAVIAWLNAAVTHQEIVGFAIGRTVFMDALKRFIGNQIPRRQASEEIAGKYSSYVSYWRKMRFASP